MLGSKQKSGKFSWPWNKAIEQSLFESELHTRIRARTQFDREYREKYPYISNAELDLRWENGEGEEILASIIRQPPKTTSSSFSAGLAKKFFYAAMVVAAIGVVSAIAIPVFKNGFAAWEQSREESRKAEAHQELEAKKKAIATSASIAGMFWASAIRQCSRIGLSDVRRCARHEALVIQEGSAVEIAKLAVKTVDEYFIGCNKHFTNE